MGLADASLDWKYFSKEVEVYKVVTEYKTFWISKAQMEVLKPALADISHKDRMIFLGDEGIRLFSILGVVKEKKRLCKLPEGLQRALMRTENLFEQKELEGFSEKVRLLLSDREKLNDGK